MRDKLLAKDPDYFKKIGKLGGLRPTTGGFAGDPELAQRAGRLAGKKSKRGYTFIEERDGFGYYKSKETGETVKFNMAD